VPSLATQLAVLAELEEPRSTIALSEALAIAEIEVEEAVTELEAAGLVEREGFGAKTRLVPVGPELPRLASRAREGSSQAAWRELFLHERARLAYVLDAVGSLELAAFVLDEPVEAVRGQAFDLVEVGVLDAEPFRLSDHPAALRELLTEIDALRARRWVDDLDVGGEVVWHLGPEIVFTATPPVQHPEVTYGGPSLFADYGVEAPATEDVYCRTRRSIDATDAILQALLTHGDDEAVREACRRLYEAEQPGRLADHARIYGLQAEATELEGNDLA
jgi:hypothetical protein